MRTQRQDYKDSSYDLALAAGCDIVQLKYDGWWSRTESIAGNCEVFSETGRRLDKFTSSLEGSSSFTIISELMHGTQWSLDPSRTGKRYLFDIWSYEDNSLELDSYSTRYKILMSLLPSLPQSWELVQNFSINDYPTIWNTFVVPGHFEGVVFRNSKAPVGNPIHREKIEITEDVQVLGFKRGETGKYSGTLGAILCITSTGVPIDVGGGFTDAQRDDIFTNQDKYLRRWCSISGKKRFASGALRHPNFVAWRPENWEPKHE